jgi:hypothetical protein
VTGGNFSLDEGLQVVPWGLRDVILATLTFGPIFGLAAAILALVRMAGLPFGAGMSRYAGGVALLILEASLIVPVWLFAVRKYRVSVERLGFRPFSVPLGCGLVVGLLLVSFTVNAIWAGLLSLFDLRVQPNILPVFGGGAVGLFIAWLAAGVVAPLVEETFFRGFVFPAFRQRFGFRVAALFNGLFFALIHFTPTAVVPLFVLGVLLCLLYQMTNSLWPPILMHGTMNTLAVLAAYAVETGWVPG